MITKSTSSEGLYFGCSIFIPYPPFLAWAASRDSPYRSSQTAAEKSAPARGQSTSSLRRRDFPGQPRDRSKIRKLFEHAELRETFALSSIVFAAEPFPSGWPRWCAAAHPAAPALERKTFPRQETFRAPGSEIRTNRRDTSVDRRSR